MFLTFTHWTPGILDPSILFSDETSSHLGITFLNSGQQGLVQVINFAMLP